MQRIIAQFFWKKMQKWQKSVVFECHVFLLKHETWSLTRGRFLVCIIFLYNISLYHFLRNEIKIKLRFLRKRMDFLELGDQIHQWTIRFFLDDLTKTQILTPSWSMIFKF